MKVLAVVTDLFFQSRIREICRIAGRDVYFVKPGPELAAAILAERPREVVVDLTLADGNTFEQLTSVERVLGFGPHVDRERFQTARKAGFDRLVSNSALPESLKRWLDGRILEESD